MAAPSYRRGSMRDSVAENGSVRGINILAHYRATSFSGACVSVDEGCRSEIELVLVPLAIAFATAALNSVSDVAFCHAASPFWLCCYDLQCAGEIAAHDFHYLHGERCWRIGQATMYSTAHWLRLFNCGLCRSQACFSASLMPRLSSAMSNST